MPQYSDGPQSSLFSEVSIPGTIGFRDLAGRGFSKALEEALPHAPTGRCVCRGIPFAVEGSLVLGDQPIEISVNPFVAPWIVFMHTCDVMPEPPNEHGFPTHLRGHGRLNEHVATYTILYTDGSSADAEIRRRHEIGFLRWPWGENCLQAVAHRKPRPVRPPHEQPGGEWGFSQMRVASGDGAQWTNWLWAWENPEPEKQISGFRFTPVTGPVLVSAVSAGRVTSHPFRWQRRSKAVVDGEKLATPGKPLDLSLDEQGRLEAIQLDLGQIISATPRKLYPNKNWESSYNNTAPELHGSEVLIEYTAHEEARFHLWDGSTIAAADVGRTPSVMRIVPPSDIPVTLRIVDKATGLPVPVKLHVHGEQGEYLAPIDRHRIPNPAWFEDYSVDFVHEPADGTAGPHDLPLGTHVCTYVPGVTRMNLPPGRVYVEVSKGFEITPVRKTIEVSGDTEEVRIELDRVLPWRERGWVTADTHVHFLSPQTALLEGAAEGVNVINLLASQWGELMTNVGDFDGRTTWGSRETGGDGEYLVRVGTENRQHVLGHISLLGYEGRIIAPMTTGGPDESALGDPVAVLLTEWARQCRSQDGLVVIPHFPDPRAENAATIVEGAADAVEMTSWGRLYDGISPYSLWDWYRYLNCGYPVAAVGGTDKMSAAMAIGTVRTYARIAEGSEFTYDEWKAAVRRRRTFVTYGPLLEFYVDGEPMGAEISMAPTGGTVDVHWEVSSVTVPVSSIELVVNGEIRERRTVSAAESLRPLSGGWNVKVGRSSWLALLVRGHYPDKSEIIAAHSSAVFIRVEGSDLNSELDAVSILEQIEGALAFLDTVGTRAETNAYRRMRMVLESAHRSLHNRMHQAGHYHEHTAATDHPEHHH